MRAQAYPQQRPIVLVVPFAAGGGTDSIAREALRKRFTDEGAEPFRGSPADFAAVLRDELKHWRKVVRDAGIKLD